MLRSRPARLRIAALSETCQQFGPLDAGFHRDDNQPVAFASQPMHTDRLQGGDDAVSGIRYAEKYQLHGCLTLERRRVLLSAGRLQQLLHVALLLLLAHLAAVQSKGGASRKLQMSSCTSCVAVCCMQMRILCRITISTQCSLLHSFVASTVALRRHNVRRPVRLADILGEPNAPRHLPHAAAMHWCSGLEKANTRLFLLLPWWTASTVCC